MNKFLHKFSKEIILFIFASIWFYFFTGGIILNPFYIDWILPSDAETHWLGWQFYKEQPFFQFPLFKNPNYGLELGSSLVLNDSLAIMAILFKPFASFIPFEFQYFGIWIYMCFLLQTYAAFKIFSHFTTDNYLKIIIPLFFILLPPFLWRIHGHFALIGQWTLLFGLFLYITKRNFNFFNWILLISISFFVNAYLSAMIMGLFVCDLIKHVYSTRDISLKASILYLTKFLISVIIILFSLGYLMVGKGAGGSGYGRYNANLNSFFDPDTIWSTSFIDLPTPIAGYEGFAFPGLGLFIIFILVFTRIIFSKFKLNKFYLPLICLCLIFYIFALSNNIIFGKDLLFTYEVPKPLIFLTKIFRSSGRFIWPLFYVITIGSFIFLLKNYPKRYLRYGLLILLILQIYDLKDARNYFNYKHTDTATHFGRKGEWESPMKNEIWQQLSSKYKKIYYVYTSNRPKDYFPISHFAAKNKMSINTGYFSRMSKAVTKKVNRTLKRNMINNELDNDALYFIYDEKIWLLVLEEHSESDLIKEIDGFRILAPNFY